MVSRSAAAAAATAVPVLGVGLGGDAVEQPGALLEVVGQVLGRPGRPRPSPRRRAARWPAGRSTPRRGRSSGPRGRGRRSRSSGRAPAASLAIRTNGGVEPSSSGAAPDDVGGDGVVALAEDGGGDRQVLADHGAGGEGPAGHDGGDIGDAEAEVSAASHRRPRYRGPVLASTSARGPPHRGAPVRALAAVGHGRFCRVPLAGTAVRWLVSAGASTSSVHRPRGAARAADPPLPAGDEPPLVLAPGDARPVRDARPDRCGRRCGGDPVRVARRGVGRAAGAAGQGPPVPPPPPGRRRRPGGVPDDAALVPVAGGRGAGEHRLLLRGVRHHRGAAAVLRRPRHPGRRPPQGRLRPRRAADRRRAALPRRLLHPGPVGRRLAARALPVAGPARPAAEAAARARRLGRRHHRAAARGPHPARPRLAGAGRPGDAAAARQRHRGERAGRARRSPTGSTAATRTTASARRCCWASAASARCAPTAA